MTQQQSFTINQLDESGAPVNSVAFTPRRDRNGIFEYSGIQAATATGYLVPNTSARLTASSRPGNPANFITGVARVKRKFTARMELPILVAGATDSIVDYINVDLTLACPVETSYNQVKNALHLMHAALNSEYLEGSTPLDDMISAGNEPY